MIGSYHSNRKPRHYGLLLQVLLITATPTIAQCSDVTSPPSQVHEKLEFADLDGKSHSLKASASHRALVLIFVTTDCPIANSYQPSLARLYKEFQPKGFEFVLIHEGPNQSPKELKVHSEEYAVPFSIAMDAEHIIAQRVGATKTPEVFVMGGDGAILYQGRIDNLHQGFGKKRASVTREDLRIALCEFDCGKTIGIPKTDAVGCSIQLK